MFRLTDIKPGPDPLRGGETGESFFDAYEKVLNGMYVRDYNENKGMYEEAAAFLAQKVPDPAGNNESAPLFDIYKRLQERYTAWHGQHMYPCIHVVSCISWQYNFQVLNI